MTPKRLAVARSRAMTSKVLGAVAVIVAIAAPASAQGLGLLRLPHRPVSRYYGAIQDCQLPAVPGLAVPPERILSGPGDRIAWCAEMDTARARALAVRLSVDGAAPLPVTQACAQMPAPVFCLAGIPDALVTLLRAPGLHTLRVLAVDGATALAPLLQDVEVPTCRFVALGSSVVQQLPIGSTLQGFNLLGPMGVNQDNQAKRASGFIDDGWVPIVAQLNTAGDRIFYMFRCLPE